jgi:hypothetical protein
MNQSEGVPVADLTITITGVDRLFAKLGRIQGTRILLPPMERAVIRLQRYMAKYPAPPPKSRYRRTGTLGRRWTTRVESTGDGVQGKVGNNTEYAPRVQSRKFQAKPFKGRWQTDADAIRDNRAAIVKDFNASIKEALK